MQKGTIRRCGNIWLLHWKERVVDSNGKPGWKSRARKLADVGGQYMYAKDCEHLAEEFLRDINLKASSEAAGATTIESTLLLNNFLKTYLDRVSVRLKPSTAKGCVSRWSKRRSVRRLLTSFWVVVQRHDGEQGS